MDRQLLIYTAILVLTRISPVYAAEQPSSDFETLLTPLTEVQNTGCWGRLQRERQGVALSARQLDLLEDLFHIVKFSNYPPDWAHLAIPGSHYWNLGGFKGQLMGKREGIGFVYQLPFDPGTATPRAKWAWDSATRLGYPDVEIRITWCREDGDGYRSRGSITYMAIHEGEWRFFPP